MANKSYKFECTPDKKLYWFTSVGPNGEVVKAVYFQKMQSPNRFNLALADIINGLPDFETRTNNEDLNVVLGSIVQVVLDFIEQYPAGEIFITGNTPAKTRLYQMQIAKNLEFIKSAFDVFGATTENGDFLPFKKGETYCSILVSRK